MLHAKAMAIVVAYDIYKELAEGEVHQDWKVVKTVDFHVFRETLARQMLSYNPKALKYLGDDKFRVFTQAAKARRAPAPPVPATNEAVGHITATSAGVCEDTLTHHASKKRLCGFVGSIKAHYDACNAMEEKGKKLKCVFCGKPAYQYCSLCKAAMHKHPQNEGESSCFFLWHDTGCFGLARDDWKITNKKMKDWTYPTMAEINANEDEMKRLSVQVMNRLNEQDDVRNNNSTDSDEDDD
jgi:hypothetical protein